MKHLHITDTFDFAPSSRTYTDNGFLRVKGRAARTGVYQYLASELTPEPLKVGEVDSPETAKIRATLTDRAPNDIVNVYRPAEEVFNTDSLSSYSNVDVTNDHPNAMVDSKSYKTTSVGHVISATQDGDFVNVDMIIKADDAIRDVEAGKVQLSPGYVAMYKAEKGVLPCGTTYDFKQTGIEINHVALVKAARAGGQARIFDNHGVKTMNKVTLDAGRSIEIEDAAVAALVTDSIARLEKQVTDAKAATDAATAERDTIAEKLSTADLATSDEAIAKRVADVANVQSQARRVAGDKFTCESVDTLTIQREALKVVRDSIDWSEKAEAYVQAAFDMAVVDAEATPAHKPEDQHAKLALDAANVQKPAEAKVSAYDAHCAKLQNAWMEK